MTTCPLCGYARNEEPCERCKGQVRSSPEGPFVVAKRGFFVFDVVEGFVELFKGGSFLFTRPEFHGRLAIPIVANLVAIVGLFIGLWFLCDAGFGWLLAREWAWLAWLTRAIESARGVASFFVAMLVEVLLLPTLVQIVTAAFVDPLADAAEKMLGGPRMQPIPDSFWRQTSTSLALGAKVLVLQVVVLVISLALSFCGVGIAFGVLASAYLAAIAWFDVPFARRGYPAKERLRLLKVNWARAFGFGLACQVGVLIPFFNVLLLAPAAAVGASVLFFRFEKGGGAA